MKRSFRRPHLLWQTAFAVAALSTAVSLPVVLLSVGGGVYQHEIASLQNAGYEIAVTGPGLHGIVGAHGLSGRIDAIPGVAAASPVLTAPVDAFQGTVGPLPALAEGIVPSAFAATEGPEERAILPASLPLGDPTDSAHFGNGSYDGPASGDVLVSAPFAAELGTSVGGTVWLGASADRTGATAFRISGEIGTVAPSFGPTAAYALVLPLSDLQLVVGVARTNGSTGALVDAADTIQVALDGPAASSPGGSARIAAEIQALAPYYEVSTLTEEVHSLQQATAVLTGFYVAISSIGLAVGLVFLAVVLVRQVETERRSLGIRRALGVRAREIASMMVARSLVLGAAGAAGGVATGGLLVEGLASYGNASVREATRLAIFDPVVLGTLVGGVLALAALASAAATRAALRLSIPEALR